MNNIREEGTLKDSNINWMSLSKISFGDSGIYLEEEAERM